MMSQSLSEYPLVSVVVPSFNQGHYIADTLRSILNQTYRPIEIWVIDGASTDNTVDVLKSFGDQISWISEPDAGHADALNKGFKLVKGEIVGWLNSDDLYVMRDSVEKIVAAFKQEPLHDMVYGNSVIVGSRNTLLRFYYQSDFNPYRLTRRNIWMQPSLFFRNYVVQSEVLYPYVGLDTEYWLRLNSKGYTFKHIQYFVACDRNYLGRVSLAKEKLSKEQRAKWFPHYAALYPDHNAFPRRVYDQLWQISLRLKGIMKVLTFFWMPYRQKFLNKLAFDGKIDSFKDLLYRQTFIPISRVFEKENESSL